MIDFQKNLISEMDNQKLSCLDLAKKCGLTERSISYYCNGKRSPTLESAEKVFAALGFRFQLVRESHEREEGLSESIDGKRNN